MYCEYKVFSIDENEGKVRKDFFCFEGKVTENGDIVYRVTESIPVEGGGYWDGGVDA